VVYDLKRLFTGFHWNHGKEHRGLVTIELDMPSTAMRVVEVDAGATPNTIAKTGVNRALTVIGVDVPFGWPAPFSHFVDAWTPTYCMFLQPPEHELRWRKTDFYVKKKLFKLPASSATESLGTCSWIEMVKCQGFQKQIDTVGKLTDDDGRATVIETDHIATMTALDIITLLDKTPELDEAPDELRKELVVRLLDMFKIRRNEKHLNTLVSDLRAAKALVAAVTAMLYWCEVSDTEDGINAMVKFGFGIERPNEDQMKDALKEGWIFFPRRV